MRYPLAVWRPTPKHGYNTDVHLRQGVCCHSMEGSLAAAFGEMDNPDRRASWHFSVAKSGLVYQHIDTENISWANGSFEANQRFWSIEHEGFAGEPLTEAQYGASLAVIRWLLATYQLLPQRFVTLWEHNEMTVYGAPPTACPSGRIPWARLLADLTKPIEEDDMATIVASKSKPTELWILVGPYKQRLGPGAWKAYQISGAKVTVLDDADFATIYDPPSPVVNGSSVDIGAIAQAVRAELARNPLK